MQGAGAARLYPAVGWGKTSHVPANSWSGRDLRWGKARGWRRPTPCHPAPLGSVRSVRAGPGMLPASSGERGRPLPSMAHGAVSPFTALSPASASERRDSGMKIFVTPGYRCRRLRALLLPLRLLRSGARGPCYRSWPHSPVALHRASSLASGAKPLGQSLSRSCQCKRNVCRAGGRREAPPPPLKLDRSLSQK